MKTIPTMSKSAWLILLTGITLVSASNASAAKLYKWVDDKGNISYQDQPPPKDAKVLKEMPVKANASTEKVADIKRLPPRVIIYTVDDCELCLETVTFLKLQRIPHIERPLETDRRAQELILEQANSVIAPTLFIGNKIFQGGHQGDLSKLLEEVGYDIKGRDDTDEPSTASQDDS